MSMIRLLIGIALVAVSLAEKKRYDGYQVLRVEVTSPDQAELLARLEVDGVIDIWNGLTNHGPVDVMVYQSQQDLVSDWMNRGIRFTTKINNVQTLIDEEQEKMEAIAKAKSMDRKFRQYRMDWDTYHPLEDFYEYFDQLDVQSEDVSVENIGQSFEGRDMKVLKICKGGCGNKPIMYIEGGIHAREWISPAAVVYLAKQLTSPDVDQELIDNLDWYILPSANPDGYAYSNSTERLWRKTRTDHGSVLGCKGADPNRNWDWRFGGPGTSSDKCSDVYHGPTAFSEIETANIRDFLTRNNNNGQIKFFNDVHSYSQFVLLAPGWDAADDYFPPYHAERLALANTSAEALEAVHGTEYTVGRIIDILYPACGGSLDWTLMVLDIPYSFGMELRDTGEYGFLLPPEQILPTAEETWAFHVSAANIIINEYVKK